MTSQSNGRMGVCLNGRLRMMWEIGLVHLENVGLNIAKYVACGVIYTYLDISKL